MSSENEETDFSASEDEVAAARTRSSAPSPLPIIGPGARAEDVVSEEIGLTLEFRKLLECPACQEIGLPPIYLCEKGHNLCNRCHGRLSTCPKCSAPITTMRNEMAEAIVAKFTFKCPYFKNGCSLITNGVTLGMHLSTCAFRPLICDVSSGVGCGQPIPFQDFADHIIAEHGVTGLETHQAVISMSSSVKLGQNNWTLPPHYLKIYGQTFLCYVHASYNILIAWVALCGHAHEIKDYVSAVTIFDPNKRFLQAKWIGQVHSIRKTAKEVYNSGNCLALLPESFLLFTEVEVEPNGRRVKKWKCHFEVIKVDHQDSEGLIIENIVESTSKDEDLPKDEAPPEPEELLLSNNNPSNLNIPEIAIDAQDEDENSILSEPAPVPTTTENEA